MLGPIALCVGSFLPFSITYYLNGHHFIERELLRAGVPFRKDDNAFLWVADPKALQAAADRLSPQTIREQLDHWTWVVGPKFSQKDRAAINLSRYYSLQQVEYCRNFIFHRNFPHHKLFVRSCDLGLFRLSADKLFPEVRLSPAQENPRQTGDGLGKNGTWSSRAARLRQECRAPHVREVLNLPAFGGPQQQPERLWPKNPGITWKPFVRLWLPLLIVWLNSKPKPSMSTSTVHCSSAWLCPSPRQHQNPWPRAPGHPHASPHGTSAPPRHPTGAWRSRQIHQAILSAFQLTPANYTLTQLRYDLRKLKAHGLLERDGSRYAYRLTEKGIRVALMFTLFHQRVCGPLANSLFHRQPTQLHTPTSKLQAAYQKADASIQQVIDLLAA